MYCEPSIDVDMEANMQICKESQKTEQKCSIEITTINIKNTESKHHFTNL